MPIAFIDVPTGLESEAKKRMLQGVSAALEEACPSAEATVILREHPHSNIAFAGKSLAELHEE